MADARERRRAPRRGRRAALAASALLLACALALAWPLLRDSFLYESLSEGLRGSAADGAGDGSIDWESLFAQNPDTVAWLQVDGTSIDLPVVQADGDDPDYYLTHDFWGERSSTGCLYLDCRCDADGRHMLVFGHHIGWTDLMFSEIFRTYLQEEFDGVGTATWSTPAGGDVEFEPVLAMSVDKAYAAVQSFEFADEGELREWLAALAGDASAEAEDWEDRVGDATRALTLVTCSSVYGGQRARTLLVFVA